MSKVRICSTIFAACLFLGFLGFAFSQVLQSQDEFEGAGLGTVRLVPELQLPGVTRIIVARDSDGWSLGPFF